MPLTGAEYRRVVVSRGIARAQSQLAACDPRRLRGHRDHHDCVKHADDGAGCASNEPPFLPSIAKKVAHLDLEKSAKAPVVGLTFASGVRGQPDRVHEGLGSSELATPYSAFTSSVRPSASSASAVTRALFLVRECRRPKILGWSAGPAFPV